MPKLTVYEANGAKTIHQVSAGSNLLRAMGVEHIEAPCGGNGRCGKCRVKVQGQVTAPGEQERTLLGQSTLGGGTRLACLTVVEGDCTVFCSSDKSVQVISGDGVMPAFDPDPVFTGFGATIDIGTTTLAARLYGENGSLLAQAAAPNPQRAYGADVISRIESSLAGNKAALAVCIRGGIDRLLLQMCCEAGIRCEDVSAVILSGNTTMLYLLTGRNVECLSCAPFVADELFGRCARAEEIKLFGAPNADIYLPRCISAFVGADITCALVASQICTQADSALLADIGTNGELALWHNGRLLCCSTAAGPVFEGATISQGMQACPGAIDHIAWKNDTVICHVIGDIPAVGICGSGIIDTVAILCRQGIVDETGSFEDGRDAFQLTSDVALTQKDVRMLQLAKGAICAGMLTLLDAAHIRVDELPHLAITGGFGSFLDLHNAAYIGLYPAKLESRAYAVGNAALTGASMMLLRKEYSAQSRALADMAGTIDLSANPVFASAYMECMSF